MDIVDLINAKRAHVQRLSNQRGAAGELAARGSDVTLVPQPKGKALQTLLGVLRNSGVTIKASSFDANSLPDPNLDFTDTAAVEASLPDMVVIEVKTASQTRVREDFTGFFFALTENEIVAAEALRERHRVLLFNKASSQSALTSVPEILARAKSTTWQVSVQL